MLCAVCRPVTLLAPADPHLEQEHKALVALDLLLAKDDLLQAAVAGRAPQLLRSHLRGGKQQGMSHGLRSVYITPAAVPAASYLDTV